MTNRRLIEAEWEKAARELDPVTSMLQRDELRNAFFAGTYAIRILLEKHISDSDENTPADHEIFASIEDEQKEWLAAVLLRRGKV